MNRHKAASELLKVAKELTAASEIDVIDLPSDRKALVKRVFGNVKIQRVWEGIHGYIAEVRTGMAGRLGTSELKKLIGDSNFRWIESTGDSEYSIGF